jgi:hypothetical protein
MALIKTRARGLKLDDNFAFTGSVSGAGGGKIGQVLQTHSSTADAKTANSYADITGLSLAITPSATSSKILIMAKVNVLVTGGGGDVGARVQPVRGSTVLDAEYSELYISDAGAADPGTIGEMTILFLDSPNSSSEQTYKLQGRVPSGGTATFQFDSKTSSLTLMEVLA